MKITKKTMALGIVALMLGACGDSGTSGTKDGATGDAGQLADGQVFPDSAADQAAQDGGVDAVIVPDLGTDGPVPDAPPAVGNAVCSGAQTTAIQGTNPTTITGDTSSGAPDEFAGVDCGNANGPWSGGQLYYRISLKAGKAYRVRATFDQWDGALYAFKAATSCDETAINAACAESASDRLNAGVPEDLLLFSATDEDWVIVVDSWSSDEGGTFKIEINEDDPPANRACSAAQTVTLAGSGPTTVNGSNLSAPNEFAGIDCGDLTTPVVGGQVYYKVTLPANMKMELKLEAEADLALYAFPAATACAVADINAACASPTPADPTKVYSSDGLGIERVLIATGGTDEEWIVVVDAWTAGVGGDFTLTIDSYTPETNSTCAAPIALTLGTPVTGRTVGVADEFAGIVCGGSGDPWLRGQLYYKATLQANTSYVARVTGDFNAGIYAFPAATACAEADINTACTSPTPADPFNVYSGDASTAFAETALVKPTATGDWIFVVDSSNAFGEFELVVKALVEPTNTACAAGANGPQTITLGSSPVTVSGDTAYPNLPNEFADQISCGNALGPWPGAQLYYKVSLQANTAYTFTAKQQGWDPSLYAFPAATGCTAGAIETACTNPTPADADNVYNSDELNAVDEVIKIKPPAAGDWIIVVDSYSGSDPQGVGGFTLDISW